MWMRLARERAGQWLQPLRSSLRQPVVRMPRAAAAWGVPMPAPLRRLHGRGEEICRGHWRLAECEVQALGSIIFDRGDVPPQWLAALHRFDWLHELLQQPRQLWLLRARGLVMDWLQRQRQLPALARRPDILARRLVNWSGAAQALLHEAEESFARNFLQGLAAQARLLQRCPLGGLDAAQRLEVLMARAWMALALEHELAVREQALAVLAEEMPRQFLADGGHVSRCAQTHLDLLCTLLPLRRAVMQAGLEVPVEVEQALERALPWLRMLSHADGGLALFHGGRDAERQLLARVLEHDAIAGAPLQLAPQSGYARLARGGSVALMDVGAPPAPWHNAAGALSALALEFSVRGQRIITSCGAPLRDVAELREAARLSAAHSMPMLEHADAGELLSDTLSRWLGSGAALARGPVVATDVQEGDAGLVVEAAHDAWRAAHGLTARRRLFLSADGTDLRGEDSFLPADGQMPVAQEAEAGAGNAGDGYTGQAVPFIIRFHLYPGVRASLSRDGLSVVLMLPDRSGWVFTARNAKLALEESILLAGPGGPRRSVQMVLRGTCAPGCGAVVNWRLRRSSAAKNGRRGTPASRQQRRQEAVDTPLFG